MLIIGEYLADLAVLSGGKRGLIALRSVDDAGLEGGIHIAVGHGHRHTAQSFHHVRLRLHILDTDFKPVQVLRGTDGLILGVEGAGAGGIVSDGHKAVLLR